MYEDGGTLVVKTGGGRCDVGINGTARASPPRSRPCAKPTLLWLPGSTRRRQKNAKLEARANEIEAQLRAAATEAASLRARVNGDGRQERLP